MKKLLLILVTFVMVLVGCSQNHNEQSNQQEKNKTEDVSNTGKSQSEMIKGLVAYGYEHDSYKGYDDMKAILSKKMLKQSDIQDQSVKNSHIKKETRDIKLFKDVDNSKIMMYTVKVGITNTKTKKSDYSIRYGQIKLVDENDKQKIDDIRELTKTNIPSMTDDVDY
ncbi:TPA: conjugal transfer protein TraH [Staphylococcus aureus]|uniref:TrsH/TraH family protein n=1 Tax=Staphylococcus TaxID=1279 RepID=UPI000983604B|nr:TrsH/TraH family protein [Staphylococcus aureus]AQR26696.1 conjugal transfer protein TraH [Staphylococcus aureus]AQR53215.1 conjugal transfer protein TraH [Staphylococcus aureus]MBO8865152.1 conjugal transfer protein TraH [Staphylococcus aureus]CAC9314505.1 Putative Transfer complex protein TraH [Staphylococcus aureus]HAR4273687.1 conjugal transfer protein TraH [Staphylococcus aureus]